MMKTTMKIITAMNEFKDYAVMIDTLLDNKEEFNDLSLIKSDILNLFIILFCI